MVKRILITSVIILNNISSNVKANPIGATMIYKGEKIGLELATTEKDREIGLMKRRFLEKKHGMLFIFPKPSIVTFWMKDTLIPLDMIFLREGRIRAVLYSVPPCPRDPCTEYRPSEKIDEVIELKGETAKALGLKFNDLIKIEYQQNKTQ